MTVATDSILDPDRPDYLAGAVLQSLSRAMGPRWHWGAFKTFLLGVASFGLLPILIWPRRFGDFVTTEQHQLWHLAEWLRLRTGNPQAVALRDRVDRIAAISALTYLSWFIIATVAAVIASHLWNTAANLPDDLLNLTYLFPEQADRSRQQLNVYLVWMIGVSAAYLLHWIQVQAHVRNVRRVVKIFNRLALTEGIATIKLRDAGAGLRPLWLLAAVPLVSFGVFWGVPMMLAGALHKRYVLIVSTDLRSELAFRVRALLLAQRPRMRVPRPPRLRMNCPSELCRNAVPETANFCPRCGTPVRPVLNAVA